MEKIILINVIYKNKLYNYKRKILNFKTLFKNKDKIQRNIILKWTKIEKKYIILKICYKKLKYHNFRKEKQFLDYKIMNSFLQIKQYLQMKI